MKNPSAVPLALILGGMIAAQTGLASGEKTNRAGSIDKAPAACPVTAPSNPPFSPPPPYPAKPSSTGSFWHGTAALWTELQVNGTWPGLPHNADGFTQKVFWWRPGFDGRTEPQPNLTVFGRRLDGSESFMREPPATNAYLGDLGWAILTGIDLPTTGCWEISGQYRGGSVKFVVWVAP